jgi:hypothetical protein
MSDLPTDVVIQYNGFDFPVETEIVGVQTTPIWDRAGRTITALTHEWTVKTILWVDPTGEEEEEDGEPPDVFPPQDGLDGPFAVILIQLLRPGCNLVLKNTAWGSYNINPDGHGGQGPSSDLIWGPKPQLVAFQHKGYKYAAELTWKVSFCLDPCVANPNALGSKVMEWNYRLTFGIDQSGYTRRVYSGHVSMPMTRKAPGDGSLADNVDRLREEITPSIPFGFRRESQNFELSEDKRTLNFNIVDQQMPPNAPPPGVVICDGSHSAESDPRTLISKKANIWTHTISASYEITSDRSRAEAFTHFQALIQDRINTAQKGGAFLLPLRLHIAEPEIYGRKGAALSLTYKQIDKTATPQSILGRLGLWQPVPKNSWTAWEESMAKSQVSDPRGTAQMVFDADEDTIVDLCLSKAPEPPDEPAKRPQPREVKTRISPWKVNAPSAENSFLEYELSIDVQPLDNTLYLQPLPTTPVNYAPGKTNFSAAQGYQIPYRGGPCTIPQYRGNPAVIVTLWGSAVRAGYPIAPPQLVSVGGQKPVPLSNPDGAVPFSTQLIANLGVPIVAAVWLFRYLVPCLPSRPFIAPPNPLLGSVASPSSGPGGTLSGGVAQG